jgi:hypothetical protein
VVMTATAAAAFFNFWMIHWTIKDAQIDSL